MRAQQTEEFRRRGEQRAEQVSLLSRLAPAEALRELQRLPWIKTLEVFEHDLSHRGAFGLIVLEMLSLLRGVTERRGPGVLGAIDQLELSFSTRFQASFDPASRVLTFSIGLPLLLSELEATYGWLQEVLSRREISIDDLRAIEAPIEVAAELALLERAGKEGCFAVSGKAGVTNPLGRAAVRFVLAHEVGHLVDQLESPRLQLDWRQHAWSNYADGLAHAFSIGALTPSQYAQFLPDRLRPEVIDAWEKELVADGLGYFSLLESEQGLPPTPAWAALCTGAVETFFAVLPLIYGTDLVTPTHPAPSMRRDVIRAGLRSQSGLDWSDFLAERWGFGLAIESLLGPSTRGLHDNDH